DRCLSYLFHLLLNELESPELEDEPIVIRERALCAVRHIGSFEGIKSQIGQDRPIDLYRAAQPTAGLISKAILEIVDPHRTQRSLSKIENFVPLRGALSSEQVRLIVAIKMHFVAAIPKLLALLELIHNVGVAGSRDQGWEPVQPGHNFILDLSGRHLAWPAQDHRYPKATLDRGALPASNCRLAAVPPREL